MIHHHHKKSNFELLHRNSGCTLHAMSTINLDTAASPQPRGVTFVQAVLDAALTQLAEVGFEGFSIPQVAELAGANKTSIYRRWPTKADLVRDALHSVMSHADQAPNTGELRGDLVELAKTVAAFTQSRVGTAVIRIMLAEGDNPDIRALAHAAYSETSKQSPWVVIQRAIERGELTKDADPSLMLFTIAGAIMHRVFVEHRDASDDFLKQVVDMVLYGAATKR
jgi:AcrR family transcriptional regulator